MVVYNASKIETWRQCELKYCAYYLLNFRSRNFFESPQLMLGKLIHKYFEEFYRDPQNTQKFKLNTKSLSQWKNEFTKDWENLVLDKINTEDNKAFLEQGILALENFYYYEKSRDFKLPIFLEKDFVLDLGQFKLNGKIDRIDRETDGSITIWDYKISRSIKSKFEADRDLQLTIYYLACKEFFLGKFPQKLGFYYPIQNELITTIRSEKEVNNLESLLLEIDLEVKEKGKETNNYKTNPVDWKCNSCNYQEFCPEHRNLNFKELPDLEEVLEKIKEFSKLKKEEKELKKQLTPLKEEIKNYMQIKKIKELEYCKLTKRENIEYDPIKLWKILIKYETSQYFIKIDNKSIEEEIENFPITVQKEIKESRIYKEPTYTLILKKK